MLKFMSLSSGSSGNCYYLGNGDDGILIDAGVSLRCLKKRLAEAGLSTESFSAILLTHDHMDHVRNIGSYCKKLMKPVYTTRTLLSTRILDHEHLCDCGKAIEEGEWKQVAGFLVRYFVVPHDATQTVGYAIMGDGHRFVIMTDIGRMTDEALNFAGQADTVVVESNYDMDMLMAGPYTHELKMRICQGHGHLSNDECAAAIKRFWHPGLKNIFLCHLSENNNTPQLAYGSAAAALKEMGVEKGSVNLNTLPRCSASPLINL